MPRRSSTAAVLALASLLIAVPAVAQDAASGVELIDSGEEPLVELRYAWTEGLTGTTVIEADTTALVMTNGQRAEEEQQLLTKTVTRTVTEVDDEGNARVEFSVEAPERGGLDLPAGDAAPGDAVDAMRAELAALSDYSGWLLLDPRGVVLDYGVDGLGEAHAALLVNTRGLDGEVQVLPEEPVGVGAVWESYSEIFEDRLTYETERTTTLTASDGNAISLSEEYRTSSEPNLSLERVATSAGAIYMSQEVEGVSDTDLALDSLVQSGTGELLLTLITGTSAGGYGIELQIDLEMDLTASADE